MHPEQIVMLLAAAGCAGWVDAVVGGGGLLQLPALLLAQPAVPVAALATNKLASFAGVTTAAVTYTRRTKLDLRVAVPAAGIAVFCAGLGAACASVVSSGVLRPLLIVVLVGVAVFVALRPGFGAEPQPVLRTRARTIAAICVPGIAIAFYDGLVGPGTGTFLVIAFTTILGLDFVHGSAMSKIVNAGTNFGAVVVFGVQGHIMWLLGLAMAVCNVAGALTGAHMALRNGAGFVRVVLLCVVTALVVKLGYDSL